MTADEREFLRGAVSDAVRARMALRVGRRYGSSQPLVSYRNWWLRTQSVAGLAELVVAMREAAEAA